MAVTMPNVMSGNMMWQTNLALSMARHLPHWRKNGAASAVGMRRVELAAAAALRSVPFPRHLPFGYVVRQLATALERQCSRNGLLAAVADGQSPYLMRCVRGRTDVGGTLDEQPNAIGGFLGDVFRRVGMLCGGSEYLNGLAAVYEWSSGAVQMYEQAECYSRAIHHGRIDDTTTLVDGSACTLLRRYADMAYGGYGYWRQNLDRAAREPHCTPGWRQELQIRYMQAELSRSRRSVFCPQESRLLADLLRDVIREPHSLHEPVAVVNPAWLTPTVTMMVANARETDDYSSLPVLADALQDAGCEDGGVLNHLRGPTTHCHGCWVLELLAEPGVLRARRGG